jgi:hypothetical protein
VAVAEDEHLTLGDEEKAIFWPQFGRYVPTSYQETIFDEIELKVAKRYKA